MTDKTMLITLTLPGDASTAKLFEHFPPSTLYARTDIPSEQLNNKSEMRELGAHHGIVIYRGQPDQREADRILTESIRARRWVT